MRQGQKQHYPEEVSCDVVGERIPSGTDVLLQEDMEREKKISIPSLWNMISLEHFDAWHSRAQTAQNHPASPEHQLRWQNVVSTQSTPTELCCTAPASLPTPSPARQQQMD